jgi:hypothetical protein
MDRRFTLLALFVVAFALPSLAAPPTNDLPPAKSPDAAVLTNYERALESLVGKKKRWLELRDECYRAEGGPSWESFRKSYDLLNLRGAVDYAEGAAAVVSWNQLKSPTKLVL